MKIVRKGFTIIPDFANTGFMIQGASLAAAVADCGDLQIATGLAEMMTAYVILSRVTKADGLLLLRAFNPDLFRMGAAPGPHCLLKLLRARFKQTQTPGAAQDSNSASQYGLAEARAEYDRRILQQEVERRRRKTLGPQFPCFLCGKVRGPSFFGADPNDEADVVEKCWSRGELLVCLGCHKGNQRGNAAHAQICGTSCTCHRPDCSSCNALLSQWSACPQQLCTDCKQMRDVWQFDDTLHGSICESCRHDTDGSPYYCKKCDKARRKTEVYFTGEFGNELVCRVCAPEMHMLACGVCESAGRTPFVKPSTDFPPSERGATVNIRRCWQCFTCGGCAYRFSDKGSFHPGTSYCRRCFPIRCDVCKLMVAKKDFPEGQIHNQARNQVRRCTKCFVCINCGETIAYATGFTSAGARCKSCEVHTCDRCQRQLRATDFEEENLRHASESERSDKLVCKACVLLGFKPSDLSEYNCSVCGPRGRTAFASKDSKCCKECTKTHERHRQSVSQSVCWSVRVC